MEGDIEEMNIIKNNLEQTSGGGHQPSTHKAINLYREEATNVVSFVKGGVKLKFALTRDYL